MRWSPQSSTPPNRALLIQFKGVGDVVLTTSAVDALHHVWPNLKIDLWTDPAMLTLFYGDPRVSVLWPRRKKLNLVRQILSLRKERYDLVLDFQTLTVSAIGAWLTGSYSVGFTRRGRSWAYSHHVPLDAHQGTDYAADHKLDLIRCLGFDVEFTPPALAVRKPHAVWQGRTGVLAAPVSGVPYKRWAPGNWAEALDSIHRTYNVPVVLTGGPGERDQVDAVSRLLIKVPHTVHMSSSLDEFAQLAAGAEVFLGSDNGPRHAAAALGVPTVTWFGPQNPTHWTLPGGNRHAVLWDRGLAGDRHVRNDLWLLEATPANAAGAALELLKMHNEG